MIERYSAFRSIRWAGNGAQLQRDLLQRQARESEICFADAGGSKLDGWTLAAPENNLAKHVARLALQVFRAGRTVSPDSLSAIYVRPSDAELNQPCR